MLGGRREEAVDRRACTCLPRAVGLGTTRVTTRPATLLELEVGAARARRAPCPDAGSSPPTRLACRAQGVRRSRRSAKPRVKPSGMCWATTKAQGGASGKAPKICMSAAGPPVEDPIATSSRARPRAAAPSRYAQRRRGGLRRAARAPSRSAARESRAPCGSAPARSRRAPGVARGVGLAMKSTAPSSSARKTSLLARCAPADHHDGRRDAGLITRRRKVKPSIFGISRSSVMRSGLELEGLAQRLLAVSRDSDDLDQRRGLEHSRDRLPAEGRVVDHEHADELALAVIAAFRRAGPASAGAPLRRSSPLRSPHRWPRSQPPHWRARATDRGPPPPWEGSPVDEVVLQMTQLEGVRAG